MSIDARLSELGITLPQPAAPVAALSSIFHPPSSPSVSATGASLEFPAESVMGALVPLMLEARLI